MTELVNPRIALREERQARERGMIDRRGFLGVLTLGAGTLVLGAEALEAYERLTYQKRLWPGYTHVKFQMTELEMSKLAGVIVGGVSTFSADDVAILRRLGYRLPREQRTERVEKMLAPFTGWRIT